MGGYNSGRLPVDPLEKSVAVLLSILLGAFLCGLLIDKNQAHLGGKSLYGLALIGNSMLLLESTLVTSDALAACLASAACGLQNAMCTSHFGAVVRTTHVTGTLTDIGSTLGRIAIIYIKKGCRRSRLNVLERAEVGVDARKLLVLGPMWVCFLLGTFLGAFLGSALATPARAMLLPAGFTFTTGAIYTLFRQRFKNYFKALAQQQLRHDVEDAEASIARAHSHLRDVRIDSLGEEKAQAIQAAVIENLESMGHIVESIHQVGAEIEELHSEAASPSCESKRSGQWSEACAFGRHPDV